MASDSGACLVPKRAPRKGDVMRTSFVPAFVAAATVASFSLVFDSKARADDWGCQVILCLSNPGGPTQYAECRPPIQKLWRHLAKGRSFPTCSGVGFRSSRPGYEPYFCNEGYTLTGRFGPDGWDATCVSTEVKPVESYFCSSGSDSSGANQGSVASPQWRWEEGRLQCVANLLARPNVRDQPRYIDITIDGVGKQRVWY